LRTGGVRHSCGTLAIGVCDGFEAAAGNMTQSRSPQPPNLARAHQAKTHDVLHEFRLAPASAPPV
jgi:hypothetical protein